MKTVTINRNSWHFWLAGQWAFGANEASDFCTYLRWVALGATKVLFLAIIGIVSAALVGWVIGDFLGWLIAGLLHGFVEPWVALVFLYFMLGGVLVGAFLGARAAAPVVADHSPAFLRNAYWILKDRVCYRVEVR